MKGKNINWHVLAGMLPPAGYGQPPLSSNGHLGTLMEIRFTLRFLFQDVEHRASNSNSWCFVSKLYQVKACLHPGSVVLSPPGSQHDTVKDKAP